MAQTGNWNFSGNYGEKDRSSGFCGLYVFSYMDIFELYYDFSKTKWDWLGSIF